MKLFHALLLGFGAASVSAWELPPDLPDGVYRVDFHDDDSAISTGSEDNHLSKRSENFTITRLDTQPQRRGVRYSDALKEANDMIDIINLPWDKFKKSDDSFKMELHERVTKWKDVVEEDAMIKGAGSYGLTPLEAPKNLDRPPSKVPQNLRDLYQFVLEWLHTAGEILRLPAPTYYNPFSDGVPSIPAPVQFLPERPVTKPKNSRPPKGKPLPPSPNGLKAPLPVSEYRCGFNVPRLNRRDYEQARDGLLAYCDDFMIPRRSRHIAVSVNGDVAAFVCNSSSKPNFCSRDVWDWVEANYFDRICHPRTAAWVHSKKTRLGYGRGWKNMKMCVDKKLWSMTWVGSATDPFEKEKAKAGESLTEKGSLA